MGFNIYDLCLQAAKLESRFAHLDIFPPTCCDEHFDLFITSRGNALNFKIQCNFFKGIGDVLVGFQLQLILHFVFAEGSCHFDGLGNNR